MNVLFLNHETKIGGGETTMLQFAKASNSFSVSAGLIVPQDGPLVQAAEDVGMRVHCVRMNPILLEIRRNQPTVSVDRAVALSGYVMRLRRAISGLHPDVVVSNSMKAHIYGGLALIGTSVPFGWRLHDIVDSRSFGSVQRKLIIGCGKWFPKGIAAVSAVSANAMLDAGVSTGKLTVLHNGIETSEIPTLSERNDFRSRFGISEENIVVTLAGRIMPEKGHEILIEAAGDVVEKFPQVRFLFVGDAFYSEFDYAGRLRELLEKAHLNRHFIFTGFCKEMSLVYGASDIVVHPSIRPESFPTVALEAMASGKFVVASDSGGISEIIDDGIDGYIAPMGDASALAQRILTVLSAPKVHGIMANRGRKKICSGFSMQKYVEQYQLWLQELSSKN